MQKYYKVVRVEKKDGKRILSSAFAHVINSQLKTIYAYNQWTFANPILLEQGLGLCVFDNYSDALYYYHNTSVLERITCEIWQCDVNVMNNPYYCRIYASLTKFCGMKGMTYDRDKMSDLKKYCDVEWPKGTILAESIRLRKKCHIE